MFPNITRFDQHETAMPGKKGGMNTKKSRAVSRGRGGSEDESPGFQIKDGEIVAVGDAKGGEKEQFYIRLDQEGVVPPPFDRSLIGKAENGGKQGGEKRAASQKRRNAHGKRQGVSRRGSLRYINIPSRIGIALDSVKAARLKATFYDKLYQEKKAREEKLLANEGATVDCHLLTLSADTCERALAKVRKSRSGPFYLNHLSLYVKSDENGPDPVDNSGVADGCVSLKSRSPNRSVEESVDAFAEYDDLQHLLQRSKNCMPRDLPITNKKSSSTGIFYKARSEKLRRQSRWSPSDSLLSCPSSYSDSPRIVNAAQDWVERDAACAADDATVALAGKSTSGGEHAAEEDRKMEDAREKAIREATGLDFKSLKLKLDLLVRKEDEIRENKRARSMCNQLLPDTEIFMPAQITGALGSKPTPLIKSQKSKRAKKANKKSSQRKRADSQSLARSHKKHVAFAVFDSPLECSNNRIDTGDYGVAETEAEPRIIQAPEPDTRGLLSVSVSLSDRHVAKELSVASEISGASGNMTSTTKSCSLPATGVRIRLGDRSKGKYFTTVQQRSPKHASNRSLRKKSPAIAAEEAGKVASNEKAPATSPGKSHPEKPEKIIIHPHIYLRKKAKRNESFQKTSAERVMLSQEEKSHSVVESERMADDYGKTRPYRSFGGKERSATATKRNAMSGGGATGHRDCQASASKVTVSVRERLSSPETKRQFKVRASKSPMDTAENASPEARDILICSEAGHGGSTMSPGNSALSNERGSDTIKSDEQVVTPGTTGFSISVVSAVLGGNDKPAAYHLRRRTSDPPSLRPSTLKRFVKNRVLEMVGKQNKSPVNDPVKREPSESKSPSPRSQLSQSPTIRRLSSELTGLKVSVFSKSLSEITGSQKKSLVASFDPRDLKESPRTAQSSEEIPHGTDGYKADLDTDEVMSVVHKRLYCSVSSQSISGSGSSHVEGFQTFKALTRGSYSVRDVTGRPHGRYGEVAKSNGLLALAKPVSPVEHSSPPSRISETLTTVNEVSVEIASEEYKVEHTEMFAAAHVKSLFGPEFEKTFSRATGIYRHRIQGGDDSSKDDDTSQKNTYLDMLFSEVIPRANTQRKKQPRDEEDISSSVDPALNPKTNPADSYFLQASVAKPEVYGVSEMLSDLRKVLTTSKLDKLQEARAAPTMMNDKASGSDDSVNRTLDAKSAGTMSENKQVNVAENTKAMPMPLKSEAPKAGTVQIRSFTTQAQKAGVPRSSKSRPLYKPSVATSAKKAASSLSGLVNVTKPTNVRRLNAAGTKTPTHAVLRTNVRPAHLSKNSAALRQVVRQKWPAPKALLDKVTNDARTDKMPSSAKPQSTMLVKRASKTNSIKESAHKQPTNELSQPMENDDVYTEPPSEAARRQKLAYMNYVKTGTRLVFPENTIQVIKYISHLGGDCAELSGESSPTQSSSKKPRPLKSPPADGATTCLMRDKKAQGNNAGGIDLTHSRVADAKRYYASARRKATKMVAEKSCGSKSKRAKVSTELEENSIRQGSTASAMKLIRDSSAPSCMKAVASPASAQKRGRAAKHSEKCHATKRCDIVLSTHQKKLSRRTSGEIARSAPPQSRRQTVKLSPPPKGFGANCLRRSKVKEGASTVGSHQAEEGSLSSVGRQGYLPLARKGGALKERLRKPRGDSRYHPAADEGVLAVGFEENIIKLADNLLKPGQKIFNLAYDGIMRFVHRKRNFSRDRTASPASSPTERRVSKKKHAARKTKARPKKQRAGGKPAAPVVARRQSHISRPRQAQEAAPESKRVPACPPAFGVDDPCAPGEIVPSGVRSDASRPDHPLASGFLNKAEQRVSHLTTSSK